MRSLFRRVTSLFSSILQLQKVCGRAGVIEGLHFWSVSMMCVAQARFPARWRKPRRMRMQYRGRTFDMWLPDRTGIAVLEEVFVRGEYVFEAAGNPACIIDAGANIGAASAFFACMYPGARIYAIEPDPHTCRVLRKNLAQFPNASVHELALSDADGTVDFYVRPESSIGSSIVFRTGATAWRVQAMTLDSFMATQGLNDLGMLKFDVEGAEDKIIGAIRDMRVVRAYIGEIHEDLMHATRSDIERRFAGFRVSCEQIAKQRWILRAHAA